MFAVIIYIFAGILDLSEFHGQKLFDLTNSEFFEDDDVVDINQHKNMRGSCETTKE